MQHSTETLPVLRPYLLYVGALEPRKGVISLVDAFERMASAGSELQLILAGDGASSYRRALSDRIAQGSIRERIEIVSGADRSRIIDLIAHASALVMPTHAEGFALPVLEALALGTPVVASDIPSIRSWADDAVHYAPVGETEVWAEKMSAAVGMDNTERRRRQAFTRRFRWSRCAAELMRF